MAKMMRRLMALAMVLSLLTGMIAIPAAADCDHDLSFCISAARQLYLYAFLQCPAKPEGIQ